jgi:hypothetical protein
VRNSTRLALVATGAAAAFCATVLPAAATPTTQLNCESYALTFSCSEYSSGLVSTPTIQWSFDGSYASYYDGDQTVGGLGCGPVGSWTTVSVTVTDASGPTTVSRGFACSNAKPR